MGMDFRELLPHIVAMLGGGLATSLGLGVLARRGRGRALLGRTKLWAMLLLSTVSVGGLVGGFFWIFRKLTDSADSVGLLGSPWSFLLFGAVAGLPFSLPALWVAWSEERPEKKAAQREKVKKATKADRLAYAQDLARQIQEFALTKREITASVRGEKGNVLVFEGDLERQEGDRLTAALRADLEQLGFERIEGEGPKGNWWSRV